MNALFLIALLAVSITGSEGFSSTFRAGPLKQVHSRVIKNNGARSMTAVFDVIAGLALATQLNSAPIYSQPKFMSHSMSVAVTETRQGMYKEYSIDMPDAKDTVMDDVRRSYKSADETEEGKTKYWAIFAVLVAGSFIIPMAQYYWYVAEEKD